MPATTKKQLRAVACKQLDELHAQLDSLFNLINSSGAITKSQLLALLRNAVVNAHEARAILRLTAKDINKELLDGE